MKLPSFILESPVRKELAQVKELGIDMDLGWGNGYVAVPPGHPLHGMFYNDIDIDIHGGLTYSGPTDNWQPGTLPEELVGKDYWAIGFDTAHCDDTIAKWPKEAVQAEADRLLVLVQAYQVFPALPSPKG